MKKNKRKLNYRKMFIYLIILAALIFVIINRVGYLMKKDEAPPVSSTSASVNENKPKSVTINMSVIGDIMCHSTNIDGAYNSVTGTYDFSHTFSDIEKYIKSADIAVGNLETTFAGADWWYSGYPTFNSPPELGEALKNIGVDVLSTANNHSLDKGYNGLVNTLNELDRIGIAHTGTYRNTEEQNDILVKDVNGIKIAFLAFSYGTNGIPVPEGKEYCINLINEELMLDQINKAKEKDVDIICVNMHWGDEYKLKQNSTQEYLAEFLFKNGVDLILGSHPHVLEPMEKREITLEDGTTKEGFVIYSLGNFVSGQVAENTKNSVILNIQITKKANGNISIDSIDYTPIYCHDQGKNVAGRYKLIDINKAIENYENGTDISIGTLFYNTLKTELGKIVAIMDM